MRVLEYKPGFFKSPGKTPLAAQHGGAHLSHEHPYGKSRCFKERWTVQGLTEDSGEASVSDRMG
jgi:hypothetical protein